MYFCYVSAKKVIFSEHGEDVRKSSELLIEINKLIIDVIQGEIVMDIPNIDILLQTLHNNILKYATSDLDEECLFQILEGFCYGLAELCQQEAAKSFLTSNCLICWILGKYKERLSMICCHFLSISLDLPYVSIASN